MTQSDEALASMVRSRAREVLDAVLSRAGYSIDSTEDMTNLARDMRWVAEKRRSEEASDKRWWAVVGAILVASISAIGTILASWVAQKWSH